MRKLRRPEGSARTRRDTAAGLSATVFTVALVLVAALPAKLAAAEQLFTETQAARGERAFLTNCAGCHGYSMISIFARYRNAFDYFGVISTSMPWEDAGALPIQDYIDIVAYMMRENGYASGGAELPPDRAVLEQIQP
ncbi:MAG: cytochrome c [Phaeovulum sp.]|uniref:c-type cytochrome n=1 Tax=Phaeovulum sp. TaxID=2934796 RepID=UPI002734352A|nr:cytochrome c [Phaeovulum sp.]MDP3862592.1 cytochrome c [Phaeovulum sp.]